MRARREPLNGANGWPQIPCLACGCPIPWHTDGQGRAEPPKLYYARKTCGRCHWKGAGLPPRRLSPEILRRLLCAAAGPAPARPDPRPRREEVRACRRCGAGRGALYETEVGWGCLLCGGTTLTADPPAWRIPAVARRAAC